MSSAEKQLKMATPLGGSDDHVSMSASGRFVAFESQASNLVPGDTNEITGGASFGLFRQTAPGTYTKVASLKGGYGTVGDSVVTAVPLSLLHGRAELTDVTAYTAVGSYLSGATKVLDSLRVTR